MEEKQYTNHKTTTSCGVLVTFTVPPSITAVKENEKQKNTTKRKYYALTMFTNPRPIMTLSESLYLYIFLYTYMYVLI